jgi:hypothetical protein
MMTEHSPGPWSYKPVGSSGEKATFGVYDAAGKLIAGGGPNEADVGLMAAALDLLNACRCGRTSGDPYLLLDALRMAADQLERTSSSDPQDPEYNPTPTLLRDFIPAFKAAIDKVVYGSPVRA